MPVACSRACADLGFDAFASGACGHRARSFDGLEEFRQHLGGRLTITMLRGVGEALNVHEVDKRRMIEAIERVRGFVQSRGFSAAQHERQHGCA